MSGPQRGQFCVVSKGWGLTLNGGLKGNPERNPKRSVGFSRLGIVCGLYSKLLTALLMHGIESVSSWA